MARANATFLLREAGAVLDAKAKRDVITGIFRGELFRVHLMRSSSLRHVTAEISEGRIKAAPGEKVVVAMSVGHVTSATREVIKAAGMVPANFNIVGALMGEKLPD